MSHGSKKWIKDYRGCIKRSHNRTKIDHYAGLKKWNVHYTYGLLYGTAMLTKDFCPQCKHVQKAILNDMEGFRAAEKRARVEWKKLYGDVYYVDIGPVDAKHPWRTHKYFYDFFREQTYYPGALWHYDTRSYLCYKHERMYEQERAMWDENVNGKKANYGWDVKNQRRAYRRKVKHILERAKFDEELYDELPPKTKEWLD